MNPFFKNKAPRASGKRPRAILMPFLRSTEKLNPVFRKKVSTASGKSPRPILMPFLKSTEKLSPVFRKKFLQPQESLLDQF